MDRRWEDGTWTWDEDERGLGRAVDVHAFGSVGGIDRELVDRVRT